MDRTRRGLALLLLLAGCGEAAPPAELRIVGGDAARGRAVIAEHGCGACHMIPGVIGAVAWVGPPLTQWARRGYVGGRRPNTPENLVAFLINPQEISPGSAMPALGLTEAEARDAATYLYTIGEAPAVPAGMPLAAGEAGTQAEPRMRPRGGRTDTPRAAQ
jgi:cytochrome c2